MIRRSSRSARALAVAVLALTVTACASEPLPSPNPQADAALVPVVDEAQVGVSLDNVTAALEKGDASMKADDLKGGLTGPALAQRAGAYLVKSRDKELSFSVPLGSDRLQDVVPQDQGWPRAFLTVTQADGDDNAPDLMLLTQANARAPYLLTAYTQMAGGATLPLTLPTDQGVEVLAPDVSEGLASTPAQALAGYADVLTTGDKSRSWPSFAETPFTASVLKVQSDTAKELTVTCKDCFGYSVKHTPREGEIWSFRTEDGGALVMGALDSTLSISAKRGYTMTLEKEFKAVSGKEKITKKGTFNHIEVVALYLPPEGAEDPKIQVVGVDRVPVSGTVT